MTFVSSGKNRDVRREIQLSVSFSKAEPLILAAIAGFTAKVSLLMIGAIK